MPTHPTIRTSPPGQQPPLLISNRQLHGGGHPRGIMTVDEWAANRWTLWGFQRRTHTDNTNPIPQILPQQHSALIAPNGNNHPNHQQPAPTITTADHPATTDNR